MNSVICEVCFWRLSFNMIAVGIVQTICNFLYNLNTAREQVSLNNDGYDRQPGRTVGACIRTYCVTKDSSCVRHSGEAV